MLRMWQWEGMKHSEGPGPDVGQRVKRSVCKKLWWLCVPSEEAKAPGPSCSTLLPSSPSLPSWSFPSKASLPAHLEFTAPWRSTAQPILSHQCDFCFCNRQCDVLGVVSLPVVRHGGQMHLSQLVQQLPGVFESGLVMHLHGAGLPRPLHCQTHSLKLL